jgi:tetratricopeptide (TPR) repeat protein
MPGLPLALILAALAAGTLSPPASAAPLRLAQAQLSAEDIFWQSIQNSSDPAMYQAYLDQVGAGRFTGTYKALAEIRIASLSKTAPSAPAAQPQPKAPGEAPGRAVILNNPDPVAAPPASPLPQPAAAIASPDIEACDRAAAAPADPEKPANIPGVTYKEVDSSAAIRACRKAVEIAGAPRRVLFQLGRAIRISGNTADALTYLRKAVELGHAGAMYDLAGILRHGAPGAKRDPGLAMALYERAAATGLNEALVQLGAMYAEGRGVRRDYAKAIDYYQRAMEAKTPGAYTNMGVLAMRGQGVPRNRDKACEYWRQGSALGDDVAARNLKRSCRIR